VNCWCNAGHSIIWDYSAITQLEHEDGSQVSASLKRSPWNGNHNVLAAPPRSSATLRERESSTSQRFRFLFADPPLTHRPRYTLLLMTVHDARDGHRCLVVIGIPGLLN
jgi:hypothetical protein